LTRIELNSSSLISFFLALASIELTEKLREKSYISRHGTKRASLGIIFNQAKQKTIKIDFSPRRLACLLACSSSKRKEISAARKTNLLSCCYLIDFSLSFCYPFSDQRDWNR